MRPPVPLGLLSALLLAPWTPGFGQNLNFDIGPVISQEVGKSISLSMGHAISVSMGQRISLSLNHDMSRQMSRSISRQLSRVISAKRWHYHPRGDTRDTEPGEWRLLNQAPAPVCADSATAFRRIIEEFQSRQKNVAISVGIMRDGQIVFLEASGLADREAGVAATPATRFGIASMTKAFTGAALLKLAEQGRIDLDAEIQKYVPEFPRHPAGPVTLRMLAAHVGGIRHWGRERNAELYARHIEDVVDILPLFKDNAFVVAPGTRYSYSSYGYNLLAMAIQRASGVSFQQYMQDEVLTPLRLTTLAFDYPGLDGAARPARYSWYDLKDYHDLDSAPVRVPDWDYSHNMGGGNMVAAVGDLLRFGRALRGPGFFSEATLKEVWRLPVMDTITTVMSFGWFVRSNPDRLGIGGSNAGLQSGLSVWKDEDFVVAALANSWGAGSRSGEFMDDGARGLLGRLASVCGVQTEPPTP